VGDDPIPAASAGGVIASASGFLGHRTVGGTVNGHFSVNAPSSLGVLFLPFFTLVVAPLTWLLY
jgi:hypothetical protein